MLENNSVKITYEPGEYKITNFEGINNLDSAEIEIEGEEKKDESPLPAPEIPKEFRRNSDRDVPSDMPPTSGDDGNGDFGPLFSPSGPQSDVGRQEGTNNDKRTNKKDINQNNMNIRQYIIEKLEALNASSLASSNNTLKQQIEGNMIHAKSKENIDEKTLITYIGGFTDH
jgi:hypothetical protein